MVDLHSHSNASDGTFSPEELVAYAAGKNVSVLALTDHDTTDGLAAAEKAAGQTGLVFVPGVELNISWPTGEFHLLGLGLQRISAEMQQCTAALRAGRDERNRLMIEKMKADGLPVFWEEIAVLAGSSCMGRPHFAEYFVQKNIVRNRQQAFDMYLGKGRPYYIDRKSAELSDAVTAIKTSGGVPVLAHPLSLYVSWGKMENVLAGLKESGIAGIEAWHPGARVADCQRLEELGKKLGFFVTAGSDFHGEKVRADRNIGHTAGGREIADSFWTEQLQPNLPGR